MTLDLQEVEDRLRRTYEVAAASVDDVSRADVRDVTIEDVRPTGASRRTWYAAAAAAALLVVVAGAALLARVADGPANTTVGHQPGWPPPGVAGEETVLERAEIPAQVAAQLTDDPSTRPARYHVLPGTSPRAFVVPGRQPFVLADVADAAGTPMRCLFVYHDGRPRPSETDRPAGWDQPGCVSQSDEGGVVAPPDRMSLSVLDAEGGETLVVWTRVPDGAAVAVLTVEGRTWYQRPVDGVAGFFLPADLRTRVGDRETVQPVLTAYDAAGQRLPDPGGN